MWCWPIVKIKINDWHERYFGNFLYSFTIIINPFLFYKIMMWERMEEYIDKGAHIVNFYKNIKNCKIDTFFVCQKIVTYFKGGGVPCGLK